MSIHRRIPLLAAVVLCASLHPGSARSATPAHLTDLSWLAGVWHAHALGGEVEDVYEPLTNGEIVSTFRLMIRGKTQRYELRRITTQHDEIVYQELGFDGEFKPAAPVPDRLLLAAEAGRAQFHDLMFHRTGANSMDVTLTRTDQSGAAQTIVIHYTRILRFTPAGRSATPAANGEE